MVNAAPKNQEFDKAAYYRILKTGTIDELNSELKIVKDDSFKERDAYEGTLLMKKAALVKQPNNKLHFFRNGQVKLDRAIRNNADNTEYHFLRLIIQEHAPKIVKYHGKIDEDSEMVKKNFKSLPVEVQQVILDYCKTSKILHEEDFNTK
jgi:hypothetical protein